MASPTRVREVARLSPEHLAVALIEKAAHALNFSHPEELAGAIELWLDDALVEGARLPDWRAPGRPAWRRRPLKAGWAVTCHRLRRLDGGWRTAGSARLTPCG